MKFENRPWEKSSPTPQSNGFPSPARFRCRSRDERSAICGPPGRSSRIASQNRRAGRFGSLSSFGEEGRGEQAFFSQPTASQEIVTGGVTELIDDKIVGVALISPDEIVRVRLIEPVDDEVPLEPRQQLRVVGGDPGTNWRQRGKPRDLGHWLLDISRWTAAVRQATSTNH